MLHATPAPALCRGGDFAGRFAVVPGSAGAGNIVYRLTLTKRTPGTCFVTGIPQLRLVGRDGRALPTNVQPEHRGALTAIRLVVRQGGHARLTARFTPDVQGPGEGNPCEPVATKLRVQPGGGGTTLVGIVPPTRVCVHGRMSATAFGP